MPVGVTFESVHLSLPLSAWVQCKQSGNKLTSVASVDAGMAAAKQGPARSPAAADLENTAVGRAAGQEDRPWRHLLTQSTD